MVKLSAMILGKDQASMLGRALTSLKGCDEVLYIDQGSTDNSVEVAKAAGARVLTMPANIDGCGALRNWAAEQMAGPWCMWISADDELEAGGADKLRAFLDTVPETCGSAELKITERDAGMAFYFPRVWRKGRKWIGRVHEILEILEGTKRSDVRVTHWRGPWHDKPSDPEGVKKALAKDMADYPNSPRWLYYYARECFNATQYDEAVRLFVKRVNMPDHTPEKADAFVLMARALWELKQRTPARHAVMCAVLMNPHYKEALQLLAAWSPPSHRPQWQRMIDGADNRHVMCNRELKLSFDKDGNPVETKETADSH